MNVFKSYDEMTDAQRRAIVDAASDAWENYNLSNPTDVGNISNGTRFLREAMRAVRKPKVKHYEVAVRVPKSGDRIINVIGTIGPSYEFERPRTVIVREWEV